MTESPKKKSKFNNVKDRVIKSPEKNSQKEFLERKIIETKKLKFEEDSQDGKTRFSNYLDDESSYGIKRQKLTYLQPHQNDEFYIEFPEFINLDYYDFHHYHQKKNIANNKTDINKKDISDNIYIVGFEQEEEYINIRDEKAEHVENQILKLINYLIENKVIELPSMEYFSLK